MEGTTTARLLSTHPQVLPINHPQTTVASRFEDAEVPHLMELIADMINRLIVHNDQIPLHPDTLTRFHSRSPPGISVFDYLARIVKYANVERSCLLITLHYIDQICTRLPRFTITSLTVHRFIIASVTVSSKALCDVFCTNTHYAKVGGIKTNELNMLEREFLAIIDWRLFCTRELLQSYYANLVRTHSKAIFVLEFEPATIESADLATPPIPQDAVGPSVVQEDVDEVDSTAHAASCSVSGTVTEDDGMCSDSDSGGDDEEDDGEGAARQIAYSEFMTVTPRTAAKRRAESVGDSLGSGAEDLRPRGRRRLDGP